KRSLLGGAILHTGHYDTRPEAHLRDLDVDQPRLTPVALECVLRVRGVEALDAPLKECADPRPLVRDRAADERQSDRRVGAPERSKDRVWRNSEVERDDAASWTHDPRELAHRRSGIVDVAQEVREGQVIEGFVREWQRLGARANERNVSCAGDRR